MAGEKWATVNFDHRHGLLHNVVSFYFSAETSMSWVSEKDKFQLKTTRTDRRNFKNVLYEHPHHVVQCWSQ